MWKEPYLLLVQEKKNNNKKKEERVINFHSYENVSKTLRDWVVTILGDLYTEW